MARHRPERRENPCVSSRLASLANDAASIYLCGRPARRLGAGRATRP